MSTPQPIAVVESRARRTDVAAPQPAEVTNPLQLLAEAQRRGASLDEIRQWMDLSDRWEATRSRKAFDAAIAAAKAEIKPIIKKREVDFTSTKGRTHYQYEDLATIAEAIDPILATHGLSYRHRSLQEGKKLTITCIVSHRDGHFEETSLSADYDESGNKNAIQSVGSAATYLQRYTLKLALGLSATKDDDGKAAGGTGTGIEYVNAEQLAEIKRLGEEIGADKEKFLKTIMVDDITQIPASNYPAVVALLKAKRAAKARTAGATP